MADSKEARQQQFLDVIDRDEAERRFHAALSMQALPSEEVPISEALGRILAEDVFAVVDVPSFDRSNFDGFAVRASDTFGADEESPRLLRLLGETIPTSVVPSVELGVGDCVAIATGGMIPRRADAVVLVEHTEMLDEVESSAEPRKGSRPAGDWPSVLIRKPVSTGHGISFTGSDIAAGEAVLRRGQRFTSRETGVLAAIGVTSVLVHRKPRVAIISTGDEIIAPGQPMQPAKVFDSNGRILSDAVRELGGAPQELGIVSDDVEQLRQVVNAALKDNDVVLLSGGTSKGAGDLSYRVVQGFRDPGIVAHGVALKPGKPICLAVTCGKPVVILPGFPTSAIFTFHEFVAPVVRTLAGRGRTETQSVTAKLAVKINSVVGRKEYNLVGLVHRDWTSAGTSNPRYVAYPMGKGSGSVTTFSNADGFISIDRNREIVAANETVTVQLLGRGLSVADLVVMGSHCLGLDYLLGLLRDQGYHAKFLPVGSTAGLEAAKRGECDVAGIHLLDPETGSYNEPFLVEQLMLVRGYDRQQGVVFRKDDRRFSGKTAKEILQDACSGQDCLMINRNRGSGTRILTDQLLREFNNRQQPLGYEVQAKTHSAVAAAILQGRADWGIAIRTVARHPRLSFAPLRSEQYDFVVPKSRADRPSINAFCKLVDDRRVRQMIVEMMGI